MMKNGPVYILLLLLLLTMVSHGMAQEIVKEFKTTTFSSSQAITASENYIYMGCGENQFYNQIPFEQYVYQLDFDLNVVDSINFGRSILDSTEQYLKVLDIEVDDYGNVYSLCYIHQQTTKCYGRRSAIVKFDDNINPLDTFFFQDDSLEITLINMDISGSSLVAAGSAFKCNDIFKPYLARIDLRDNTVTTKFFDEIPYVWALDFLSPAQFDDKIIVATILGLTSGQNGNLSTAVIDSNLEIIHEGSILDVRGSQSQYRNLRGGGAFIPISGDSIWKLSSSQSDPGLNNPPLGGDIYYWTFGASLLDTGYNVTTIDTFPLSGHYYITPDAVIYATLEASLDPYDYRLVDSVLYVQGEKYIDFDNYSSQDSTAFYLYNFNARTGTMNWMKRVQRNYTIGGHSVAALPGNRWAISFNEYNWDKYPGENLSVHLWILNGQGDIISEKEFERQHKTVEVFPNPVDEYLSVRIPADAHRGKVSYKIFDMAGNLHRSGTLANVRQRIDASNLGKGSYILLLEAGGSEFSGQFIKR